MSILTKSLSQFGTLCLWGSPMKYMKPYSVCYFDVGQRLSRNLRAASFLKSHQYKATAVKSFTHGIWSLGTGLAGTCCKKVKDWRFVRLFLERKMARKCISRTCLRHGLSLIFGSFGSFGPFLDNNQVSERFHMGHALLRHDLDWLGLPSRKWHNYN